MPTPQPITNKHGLPPEVYNALTKQRYNPDSEEAGENKTDYSVSTLIAPVQQTILRKRYPGCNSEDAIDRVWSLFGQIAHSLLEEHGSDEAVVEKRFYMRVLGKVISGQVDHYKCPQISDYKVTSAYKIQRQSFDEWLKQQNCYATLAEINDHVVETLRIIAIIRDWSEQDTYLPNYPQAPIVIIPLLKWSAEARLAYIESRVKLLIANEALPDNKLLPCTDKERWMDTKDWAIYKGDERKRAWRAFDTRESAQSFLRNQERMDLHLVQRKTEPRRCLKYCPVSQRCVQHQQYLIERGTHG